MTGPTREGSLAICCSASNDSQSVPAQLYRNKAKEWLQTLGYAGSTVTALPRLLQEFLHYQEQGGKPSLVSLQAPDGSAFIEQIKVKIGPRSARGYSNSYVNQPTG